MCCKAVSPLPLGLLRQVAGGNLVTWELLSSLSSLGHVAGVVQVVFYGVPDPTGQVVSYLRPTRQEGLG